MLISGNDCGYFYLFFLEISQLRHKPKL
jgi:hypothetical protein